MTQIKRQNIHGISPSLTYGPHGDFVQAVDVSPDGKHVVTGAGDGSVVVWTLRTSTKVAEFWQEQIPVEQVVFQSNDTVLVVYRGGRLFELRLGEGELLTVVRKLALGPDDTETLALSAQFAVLYARSQRGRQIALLDIAHGQIVAQFPLGNNDLPNASLSEDGTLLAQGMANGKVQIWRTETRNRVAIYPVHRRGVRRTRFNPDGTQLAAIEHNDEHISVVDLATGMAVGTPFAFTFPFDVAFSPDSQMLAVCGLRKGGYLHMYEIETGQSIRSMRGGSPAMFAPSGDSLLCGDNYADMSKAVRLWNFGLSPAGILWHLAEPIGPQTSKHLKNVKVFHGHEGAVTGVAFSPNEQILATAGADRNVRLWDLETGGERAVFVEHEAEVTDLAFSPDGLMLASSSGFYADDDDTTVRLWDLRDMTQMDVFNRHTARVSSVDIHPSGSLVASGDVAGVLHVWNIDTGEILQTFPQPISINGVAFSPDGRWLAAACGGNRREETAVYLWDVASWSLVHTYTELVDGASRVAFHANGVLLLVTDLSENLYLWNIEDSASPYLKGEGTLAICHPTDALIAVADGHMASVQQPDDPAHLVELDTGSDVTSIAFSGRANMLATGLLDGSVVIWGVLHPGDGGTETQMGRLRTRDLIRRYTLQLISLRCLQAQERDGDEIFIRVDGQTIWRVEDFGKRMAHHPTRQREIDEFDFLRMRQHGSDGWQMVVREPDRDFRFTGITGPLEIEIWEEDQFLRGGDDFIGKLAISPEQAGQGELEAVFFGDGAGYVLVYEVIDESPSAW